MLYMHNQGLFVISGCISTDLYFVKCGVGLAIYMKAALKVVCALLPVTQVASCTDLYALTSHAYTQLC